MVLINSSNPNSLALRHVKKKKAMPRLNIAKQKNNFTDTFAQLISRID